MGLITGGQRKALALFFFGVAVYSIIRTVYAYTVKRTLPLLGFLALLALFSSWLFGSVLFLRPRHPREGEAARRPPGREVVAAVAGGLLLGLSCLYFSLGAPGVAIGLRFFMFFGFVFFSWGAFTYLRRVRRERQREAQTEEEPEDSSSGKA